MLFDRLKNVQIILGSQSPRRRDLLSRMGLTFEVLVIETDEAYDPAQQAEKIVETIALNKLAAFEPAVFADNLVIVADTVVAYDNQILGKPKDEEEAARILEKLQGKKHTVFTAVAIRYRAMTYKFVERTDVEFFPLTPEEIAHYIRVYQPLDKAGSYGIQDWIGLIGIKSIQGSYENVVGLPTARLYQELKGIWSV